jgi:A/G-specific adenine glycosylase
MMKLDREQVDTFRKVVWDFWEENARNFPWRENRGSYQIWISEIMLQQTQTERVVPKYLHFLEKFPTVEALAAAPLAEVLRHWQGLGYNRRGLNLHRAASEIVTRFHSQLPSDTTELLSLPGIGPYTAAAIQAFAFNLPSIVIETNIRAVYLHHFFPDQNKVPDAELLPLIEQTLAADQPRNWYSALMDYGTFLKTHYPNPSRRSRHHAKQSKFVGSDRQVRGQVIRFLTQHPTATAAQLSADLTTPQQEKLPQILAALVKEGLINQEKKTYSLPS